MRHTLLQFPAPVKTLSPETNQHARDMRGGPARRALQPALVVRQMRQTHDVITVARRMRVKANDIAMVLLDCLDERRAA